MVPEYKIKTWYLNVKCQLFHFNLLIQFIVIYWLTQSENKNIGLTFLR